MPLRVYNTLSGEKEVFQPVEPGQVGIYLCGPTVYKPAHIGHAVGPVVFDVIKRYLTFKGFKVTWVVNVTDVEDKLIAAASEGKTTVSVLARNLEQKYVEALRALGVRSIDHLPRASEHIAEIIAHIQRLIERGAAYAVDGDVYFDVSKDKEYGKLTRRSPEEQFAGTREGLVHTRKRHPGDFALWKAAKPQEPAEVQFDSPWGRGRPGWHIECSAMAMRYLGKTFDIHGGGMDLKFPHHENEIAQAECDTGKPFARYWLHNGLTRFNTKKISKSDPEFEKVMSSLQLSSLLAEHPAELLRFLILQSHYRSPIEFSDQSLKSARTGLDTFYRLFERIERATGNDPYSIDERDVIEQSIASGAGAVLVQEARGHEARFLEAMDDDFNTAGAIGALFEMAGSINRFLDAAKSETKPEARSRDLTRWATGSLLTLSRILGLFVAPPRKAEWDGDAHTAQVLELLIEVRKMAREAKQFTIADHIRARLAEIGFSLEDRQDGTGWRRS